NLGDSVYLEIQKEFKFSQNEQLNKKVEEVGFKLIKELENANIMEWSFKVIENDTIINAFAIPGGKICVFTGLLQVLENDDELAVVMGHEIAHVIARHGAERLSHLLLVKLGETLLETLLKKEKEKTIEIAKIAYGIVTEIGVLLPFSRIHEEEADYLGLILMAKAGYKVESAIPFWEKIEKKAISFPKILEFLSTHPSYETRIKNIKNWIPQIKSKYAKRQNNEQREATQEGIPIVPFWKLEKIPKEVYLPKPDYPKEAFKKGYEGEVIVEALIDVDGNVIDVRILKSSGYFELDRAATESAKKARFTPGMINNTPVRTWISIPYKFRVK
ncbi:MAG: TonB family protein, partial [candidate division WOR-3 bacterium]